MVIKSSLHELREIQEKIQNDNKRECPSCGYLSLRGMPGGRDSICENCGYKDPCCYD